LAVKQRGAGEFGGGCKSDRAIYGIVALRRRLLRIHGTILSFVALASAVATTVGRMIGTGPFGFMHGNPMFSSPDLFASMGVFGIVWIPITFHIAFLRLETFAALYSQRR
jgi:hypothetical protein